VDRRAEDLQVEGRGSEAHAEGFASQARNVDRRADAVERRAGVTAARATASARVVRLRVHGQPQEEHDQEMGGESVVADTASEAHRAAAREDVFRPVVWSVQGIYPVQDLRRHG